MKKFSRNLTLAIMLASATGISAYADPITPTSDTQTGTDPVPTPPAGKSAIVTIILTTLGAIL